MLPLIRNKYPELAILEKLSLAIGSLSCLDRMMDPGIKVLDEVDRGGSRRRDKGTLSRGDTDRSSRDAGTFGHLIFVLD